MQERQETRVPSLGREDPLEEEMAPHSGILAWRIPGTEEPVGLQSTGSQRVGHDWSDLAQKWINYYVKSHVTENDDILIIVSLLSFFFK